MCQVWASNSTQPLIDTHIYFAGGTNFCVSATGNNGNISQIKDWRNPAHTRYFGYDDLNRLNSFTNGDGSMQQTYGYDSFGNLTQSGTLNFQVTYDANNHINSGGVGYDAAGNVTQVNVAGINTNYSFDGAGRLYNVNSGAAYYTYDGNGNRMRKDLNGSYTEYQYLNGQVIAERQPDGTWTDYIYANGQKIAKADAARPLIHAHGVRDNTISMACGSVWWLSGSGVPAGYTIRSGDKLVFDQLETVAHAGPSIEFTDGTDTTWNQDPQNPVFLTFDQNGENTADSTQDDGQWHHRIIDLTPVIGKTISNSNNFAHATEADTPGGTWDVYYANMSLVSTDGTVQPIFTGQQIGSSLWSACGGHDLSLATESISLTTDPVASTTYFIGDQIGSTRMVAGSGGWPTSTSTFYPFGQEQSVAADSNHYKFTGLERDQQNGETGLDHAIFRQYSSVQGRWMSPDPFDGSINVANPQTFNRYVYAANNPLGLIDPSGLDCRTADGYIYFDYELGGDQTGAQALCAEMGGTYEPPGVYNVYGSDPGASSATSESSGDTILSPGFPQVPGSSGGGGGTSGPSPAPNNAAQNWKKTQQCVSSFYNSIPGKAVQFGSPLSLLPVWNPGYGNNLKEWGVAVVGKLGGLFGSGATPGTNQLTTLSGTKTIGSAPELATEGTLGAIEKFATPAMALATVADIMAHGTCAMMADPAAANAALQSVP